MTVAARALLIFEAAVAEAGGTSLERATYAKCQKYKRCGPVYHVNIFLHLFDQNASPIWG